MRVAIYARVSTKDQNAENQLRDLRAHCKAREWTIQREFVDMGISGANQERPALLAMMELVKQRRVDCVMVWKLDRYGRSLIHLVNSLLELAERGVTFMSYTEGIDTSTSHGRLVLGVLGAIAEFERDLISERVRAGLRRARAAGRIGGRPRAEHDNAKASQLRGQGLSLRQIAAQTGIPIASLSRLFHKRLAILESVPVGEELKN